jgi:serine/threonine-protein kinase
MADTSAMGDEDQDLPSKLPGTVIAGKYRIESMIGKGGMGSVWAATHLGLGQRVAVKLIAKRYAGSREARQRFDLEAKAAAQLRSRFVVQVYDNGETEDGTPYIVMELLLGESLDQRIQRQGPVPLDAALRIIGQVGRALSRAHSLGIVHRDLKPENIFMTRTEDDDAEIAKVLDFGIAKIKSPDSGAGGSGTRTGAVLGTPLFMSPEQARGLKSVDHRTDIYSLGMVLYMMLTGQSAFSGESFGDILVAICTQPLPSFGVVAKWLPPGLDAWLQRACAREPTERFQSIDEMLEALSAAAGFAQPNLQSQEMARAGSSGLGRHAAAATGAAVNAATQVSTGGVRGTTSAVTVTGAEIPKRSMAVPALLGAGALVVIGAVVAFVALRKPATVEQTTARQIESAPSSTATQAPTAAPTPPPTAEPAPAATPGASADKPAHVAQQKGSTPVKPSVKVAPEPAKGPVKPPETKTAKPKSPDLGF